MAHLPLLKLSGLFIKTIAKPVSAIMKSEARKYPNFAHFCEFLGQGVHSLFSRINVLASGYKFVGVKRLTNDEALAKGVEYFSEFLVLSASGSIIVVEYVRGEKKNALKAAKASEKEKRTEQELHARLASIEAGIRGLEAVLDPKTLAKLQQWKSTHLTKEIDDILALHHQQTLDGDAAAAVAVENAVKVEDETSIFSQSQKTVEDAAETVANGVWSVWGTVARTVLSIPMVLSTATTPVEPVVEDALVPPVLEIINSSKESPASK